MTTEEINKEKEGVETVYEVSYLLLPSLAHEQVPAKHSSLKEMIEKAGGAVIMDENPVLIDLAYPMTKVIQTTQHKYSNGYFGWIKFEMASDGISSVKKSLDAHLDILRYLIIKTVRENTLVEGKMRLQKEDNTRMDDEASEDIIPAEEISTPEVIDKSIDDLVIA